jgi:hypothetical protein
MYYAKIAGQMVMAGIEIEVPGLDNFNFRVIEINETSLIVDWIGEGFDSNTIPFSFFRELGIEVEVIKISDTSKDPNEAFLIKRLKDNHE